MVKSGEMPLEGKEHVKIPWDSMQDGWKTVEYMCVNIRCVLIAPAKIPEREGSISVMGNCRTISHTFFSPIYPVDERNEDVGLV